MVRIDQGDVTWTETKKGKRYDNGLTYSFYQWMVEETSDILFQVDETIPDTPEGLNRERIKRQE